MYKGFIYILISMLFVACTNSGPTRITQVNEVDYPEGISVIIHNKQLRKHIQIISSRLVNAKYKKQVQLVIDNTYKKGYNLILNHEWTDLRGVVINNHTAKTRVFIAGESSKRIILNAPNFKAKDVLINISCANPCMVK